MKDVSEEMFQNKTQTDKMENMKKRVRDMARRMKRSNIYFVKSSKESIDGGDTVS